MGTKIKLWELFWSEIHSIIQILTYIPLQLNYNTGTSFKLKFGFTILLRKICFKYVLKFWQSWPCLYGYRLNPSLLDTNLNAAIIYSKQASGPVASKSYRKPDYNS